MGIQLTLGKGRMPVKLWTCDIEHEAMQQLVNVAELPIVYGPVAAMPNETHGAYKDIDTVMENQRDLVEVVHTLNQVICIKG